MARRPETMALNLTNLFVSVVEVVLGTRFVFKLLGANTANPFVNWVYDMSATLLQPFRGIFPTEVINQTYVLELNTLFAMMAYAVIGYLIYALLNAFVFEG